MDKQTLLKILDDIRSDINSAYQASGESLVECRLMRAYGRVDTLIKAIRE